MQRRWPRGMYAKWDRTTLIFFVFEDSLSLFDIGITKWHTVKIKFLNLR